jgi:hypothetical protein
VPDRLTDAQLVRIVQEARTRFGAESYWRHIGTGGVYVTVGITLREADLQPLVRYFPHGKRGFEFCRPVDEFLRRFEPTPCPLWTETPCS